MNKEQLEALKNARDWMRAVPMDMKSNKYFNDGEKINKVISEAENESR